MMRRFGWSVLFLSGISWIADVDVPQNTESDEEEGGECAHMLRGEESNERDEAQDTANDKDASFIALLEERKGADVFCDLACEDECEYPVHDQAYGRDWPGPMDLTGEGNHSRSMAPMNASVPATRSI